MASSRAMSNPARIAGRRAPVGLGTGHHVMDLLPGEQALDHFGFEVRDANQVEGLRSRFKAAGLEVTDLDASYLDYGLGCDSIVVGL